MTRCLGLVVLLFAGCGRVARVEPGPGPNFQSPDPSGERCGLKAPVAERIDLGAEFRMSFFPEPGLVTLADGDRVVVTAFGTLGANSPDDPELVLYDLLTRERTQLTADAEFDILLDVRDGRVLFTRRWGEEGVFLLDLATTEVTRIGTGAAIQPWDDAPVYRPRRMLGDDVIAWRTSDGIVRLDASGTERLTTVLPYPPSIPLVDGDRVVWTRAGDSGGIFAHEGGVTRSVTPASGWWPWHFDAAGGRTVWGTAEGIGIHENGGERLLAVPSERGCGEPVLVGDRLAFACDSNVYRYDFGTEQVTLVYGGEGWISGPRLNERGDLAWVDFTDGCAEGGTLYVEAAQGPVAVSEVFGDSWCVGHIPVPMSLQLSEHAVVWADFSGVHYALLECE